MNKQDIQKIKTGLDNYRFSYLNSYLEHEIDFHHDTIDMDDLHFIDLDDLGRL
jgi:hypothetical protein